MTKITVREIIAESKGWDIVIVDGDEFYWEFFGGSFHCVGELGWNYDLEEVSDYTVIDVEELKEEKILYIYIYESLS